MIILTKFPQHFTSPSSKELYFPLGVFLKEGFNDIFFKVQGQPAKENQ